MSEYKNYKTRIESDIGKKPEGFGGWLIVFQIYVYLSLILLAISFIFYPFMFFNTMRQIVMIATFALTVISLILFYMKNIRFRVVFTIMLAVSLLYSVYKFSQSTFTSEAFTEVIYDLVVSVLIVGGLFTSKRVKNTFS